MALLINKFEMANGAKVSSAYVRVSDPVLVKYEGPPEGAPEAEPIEQWRIHFGLNASHARSGASLGPQELCVIPYDLAGPNPLEQAYAWLKTERYCNAEDV